MAFIGIFYHLLVAPAMWLAGAILSHFLLILTLTMAWRAYKTLLVRKVALLQRLCLKPVESRQAVLITGASSGIGLAVAKHLYKAGYSVIATYFDQRDPGYEELRKLQQQSATGAAGAKRMLLHQLDVTNQEQVGQVYESVARELEEHKLDLYALINNAGLGSLQPFAWLQRRTMLKLIETNISGALLMTREFLPLLIKRNKLGHREGGRLLFVSSGLGFVPGPTYATYGLTKSAYIYFARCLNLELKERYGIQSVAVIPHNFIKNTNICAQNVQSNQLAWDELKPIERELYAREHEEQLERARSLERATQGHAKLTSSKATSAPAKSNNSSSNHKKSQSPAASLQQACKTIIDFGREVLACSRGENLAATLEESGALECFEDALRLRNPPEQIFAGDSKFQLIIGSLLLSLPGSCMGLLSSSVAPNLYK